MAPHRPLLSALVVLLMAGPCLAQGRPTIPPGQAKRAQQVPSTSGLLSDAAPDAAGPARVRTFGAWLDDATSLGPGETWLALSMSKWDMPIASGADAPVVDISVGLAPVAQVSFTLPYFRVNDRAGGAFRGVGDLYLGAKMILRDPVEHGVGIAVGPTLELLSDLSRAGTGLKRMNWVLPVNVEKRLDGARIYGSTGYFTRGVFFASGAYEKVVSDAMIVSGALTHALATGANAISEQAGLGRQRVDVSGTAAYSVSPALAIFGSLGRTIVGLDDDRTRWLVSGGVSVNVAGPSVAKRSGATSR